MASRNLFLRKPNHIVPSAEGATGSDMDQPIFEFDEAEIWSSNDSPSPDLKKLLPAAPKLSRRLSRSKMDPGVGSATVAAAAASVPVNIPDWSKILQGEYGEHLGRGRKETVGEEDDGDDGRVPPHEYLARRRGASSSVHEGIGRTLKGRDLRRVRNAIWQKTGFED